MAAGVALTIINTKAVIDARGNVVIQYKYDMLGARLYSQSMDAGERWILNDVMGKPLRSFDSRNHVFRYEYDSLHRPIKFFMQDNGAEEILTERIIYGEGMETTVIIFKILVFIPLLSFLDTMYGKQILLNLGKDNLYFRVILFALILNISINLPLTFLYKEFGTSIALIITQVVIFLGMWYSAKREASLIFQDKIENESN